MKAAMSAEIGQAMPERQGRRNSAPHIPILDPLRGLAALAVCLFHFSCGNPSYLPNDDVLKWLGSFAWLGVEAFFVISGFVIPYALSQRDYQLGDAPGFFWRRLKRLEPPYLICIALVIVLSFLSALAPGFRGNAPDLSWQRLLAHLGYLNAFLGYDWLNPVFWSLAIEFQFYLLIALYFPLINRGNSNIACLAMILFAALGLLGHANKALLIHWLPLFAIGIVTCQYFLGRISRGQFAVVLSFASWCTGYVIGWPEMFAGLFTIAVLLLFKTRTLPRFFAPLSFAGTISYSIYLMHVPIGGRVINLASRLPDLAVYRYAGIATAFAASVFVAYWFWRWVEKPSQAWSKK
jgi:peptidoglycan/LPS O-acetylase OafA/YrhL